jgi:hypothetical protein
MAETSWFGWAGCRDAGMIRGEIWKATDWLDEESLRSTRLAMTTRFRQDIA